MFTWLQTVMQRHYKWLFSILLAIIIVAFVFTIGNTGGVGSGNPEDFRRDFYGFNLNSQRDMAALNEWTAMSSALSGRRLSPQNREAAVLQRAVSLSLVDQLGIPEPNEEQFAEFLRGIPAFTDPATGQFSRDRYTQALDQAQNTPGGKDTLSLVLVQDYRIGKVLDALGGPGYVLPYMSQLELQERNTEWSIAVAELDKSTFEPEIETTPEALEAFYQNNSFRYESGPRIVVGFVTFPAKDYVNAVADPTDAQLARFYNQNRAQWPKNDEGKTKPLDEIREQVIEAYKLESAVDKAVAAGNELAVAAYNANYEGQLTAEPASITDFLKSKGLTEEAVAPFPRSKPEEAVSATKNSFVNLAGARAAAALDAERFYSDAVATDDGAAVFFLREELPSETPPLDKVRIKVMADYAQAERSRQFNLKSVALKDELQKAVDDGQDFNKVAEEKGLTVKDYNNFTAMSPPDGVDYFILSAIQGMQPGEISDLMSIGTLGTFIYVADKKVPDYALGSDEVIDNMKQIQSLSARLTTQSIMNDLITSGMEKATPHEF